MAGTEPLWTIAELGARVAAALAAAPDYRAPANGQVRAVPDRRTIRYYTTLGLLDRPAAMQGRTALYGPRHLMQLVAIKRLQAQGLSLADIQGRLAGLTRARLASLAAVPDSAMTAERSSHPKAAARAGVERFWSGLPADHEHDPDAVAGSEHPTEVGDSAPPTAVAATAQVRVELAPGVTVTLEGDRVPGSGELAALHAAARPLIEEIQRRGLVKPRGTTVEPGGEGS
jgi:DNA-binding transcriptional MerR regulator